MMKSKLITSILAGILILLSAYFFHNPKNQGVNWTFPYFSGAANFERLFDWQISPSDYDVAAKLSGQEYRQYKHQVADDTITSINNFYGYVLIALTSRTLFPYLGDLNGVIVLQILVHLTVSLFLIIKIFQTPIQRYGFLFLYAANPLIIYFVTFPIYFFWSFIPAMALVVIWFRPDWRTLSIPLLTPLLLLSILIRPTTLFLCFFLYFIVWFVSKGWRVRILIFASATVFLLGAALIQGQEVRSPWHTMYVGLGAYSNNYGVKDLSDNQSYQHFYEKTGTNVETNAIKGNYNDPVVRKQMDQILKKRYFEILRAHPLSLIRNAFLNTLQAFSVGHDVDRRWVSMLSTGVGFLILSFLVFTRQWLWITAVLSVSASYVWYFPPIPAYHFGAYLLLVTGFMVGIEQLRKKQCMSLKINEPIHAR